MSHRTPKKPAGRIRQLRPSDQPRFRDHLMRLDPESRWDRFNGVTNDTFITDYVDRSFHDGTTVIAYVEGDEVKGAAELHERPEFDIPTGEIAFSVERDRQGQGIGSKLFRRLLAHAHALGYERLLVTTHSDNRAMKALARKFDAQLTFHIGETEGVIDLSPERALPVWRQEILAATAAL
ncbi:GNAT family N-acetyltransferase [Arvimicrobium flavum]|uniref:GNAT family N-acetyltransferase n=1 Tax=Arvimicrobium flavum TaxID=3393320 RepID=UPI00237AF3F3|nr:GNAT family N-acetyltransferase [Mesorhizobium shangrilense]